MNYKLMGVFMIFWVIFCIYLFQMIYQDTKVKAINDLNSRQIIHANQAARGIENYINQWFSFMTRAASNDDIIYLNETGKEKLGFHLSTNQPLIRAITRMDKNGKIIYTKPESPGAIGQDISYQKHVKELLKKHHPVASDVFKAVQGYDTIALHVPVFDHQNFQGSLAVLINFEVIAERYLKDIKVGKTGYAWMIGSDGIELYCAVPGHVGKSVYTTSADFPSIINMADDMIAGKEGITTYYYDRIMGEKTVKTKKHAVFIPIKVGNTFWSLVVASSEDEVLQSLVSFRNKLTVIIIILLAGILFFSYFGIRGSLIVKEEKERKKAENALRESEEKYRGLFEMESDAIFLISGKSEQILEANTAATQLYGYSRDEFLNMRISAISAEPEKTRYAMEKKSTHIPVRYHKKRDGTIFPVEITGSFLKWKEKETFIKAIRDITRRVENQKEKTRLESQLHHAQKMESMGTLAGGIAHEFNNILGIILSNSELALLDLLDNKNVSESLTEIRKSCFHARDVVNQLLSFSRKSEIVKRNVIIQAIIQESYHLLRASIPKSIEIVTHIFEESITIMADPTQIRQLLINLCTNSAHAMEKMGGVLTIQLKKAELKESDIIKHHNLIPGVYAQILISDNGEGIEPEIINKVFDPFFTTKKMGKGTGMGLAIVRGIVNNHQGEITVTSEPGKGTVFTVFFPVSQIVDRGVLLKQQIETGNEKILFVDDELTLGTSIKRLLEHLGYLVEVCTKPEEALQLFFNDPNQFDLIITDMTMPSMTGDILAKKILESNPDMPILLITGFSEKISEESAKAMGIKGYLEKPFDKSDIAKKIREVLNN
ncbi:MAG: ATP-binding protein [Spirochaetes bacterium]|nr:ATP-binding protein [Spirochaetota bacterium]